MRRIALMVTPGIFLAIAVFASEAQERLRQLDAGQVKTLIIGRAITDEAHWSDHFFRDGSMKSIELGETKRGSWALRDKLLCLTRPVKRGRTETECNEIWKSGDRVEYRRDGVTISEGVLKDQW